MVGLILALFEVYEQLKARGWERKKRRSADVVEFGLFGMECPGQPSGVEWRVRDETAKLFGIVTKHGNGRGKQFDRGFALHGLVRTRTFFSGVEMALLEERMSIDEVYCCYVWKRLKEEEKNYLLTAVKDD